jgi:hypothetical protein
MKINHILLFYVFLTSQISVKPLFNDIAKTKSIKELDPKTMEITLQRVNKQAGGSFDIKNSDFDKEHQGFF